MCVTASSRGRLFLTITSSSATSTPPSGTSERPGFGVEIDPDKLERYRAAYDAEGMSTAYAASRGVQVLSAPSQ